MSISNPENQTTSPASKTVSENVSTAKETNPPTEPESKSTYSPATLLSTLLSPFSFSSTSPEQTANEEKKETTKIDISIEPSTPTPTSPSNTATKTPEPYCTPEETPLFKTLLKTRLTRTRTKQLLRAGERAYNDPPPPPGLGDCCGSSCDPCVRDLWKEEIEIWRERWGDRGVEDEEKSREEGSGEKLKKRKELEW
ncbi:hypothetical protein N7535_004369 [Penicillium sp. DV-2018c]|nr:hypothetical protein N7461_007953 [Penicillium sp. DV-2018c]KAJ5570709.1 hypothetical protein N7535_004369 [Penicillium sp. DV-2018c]